MDVMEVRENLHNQIGALDCLIRFKKSLFLKFAITLLFEFCV